MELHPQTKKVIEPIPFKMDGKKLYKFKDPHDLPETRRILFADFNREYMHGMQDKTAKKILLEVKHNLNAKDYVRAGACIEAGLDLIENTHPLEALYNMACLVYFTLEEEIGEFDFAVAEEKKKVFKRYPASSFFLPRLVKSLQLYSTTSLAAIRNILSASQIKEAAYLKVLGMTTEGPGQPPYKATPPN